MSRIDDLYAEICNYVTDFQTNHQTHITHGNKAAGTRARKGLRTLKNTASELVKLTLGKE